MLNNILSIHPDILIIDPFTNPENKLPLIKNIIKRQESIKVIILTNSMSQQYLYEAIRIGVKAYLKKSASLSEIIECIKDDENEFHLKMTSEFERLKKQEPA